MIPSIRLRCRALLALLIGTIVLLGVALIPTTNAQALSGALRLHDPSAIAAGGCEYAFTTGFENDANNPSGSIMTYRTCDSSAATGWSKLNNVWSSTPAWITTALGKTPPNIWAPDVDYFNGSYHLYYGASVWGTDKAVMGLLTASSPAGPWTDQGQVTNVNYPIDPDVVRGADNRLYISWGSFTGGGVYMHVLDETTGKLSTSDDNLWKIATGMEGVTIMQNGSYYYLFGSEGRCCSATNSDYWTVVGRATSVTGPYYDQSGTALTAGGGTLAMRGSSPKIAAGGADAFTMGQDQYLAYHYYDGNNNGQETLDIRKVTFSNGWPKFDAPLGASNTALQVQSSVMCLDVWYKSTADGAEVDQGTCNGGSNQGWSLQGSGTAVKIVNANSGKCLAPANGSTASGTTMVQTTCSNASSQQWTVNPLVGAYFQIVNTASNLCLEVYGASTANGAHANLYTCNGGTNQRWQQG